MHTEFNHLPVAVIGAGPIGLSAAVHLLDQGYTPIVFEAGTQAGANLARWGHVRMFSPWSYNLDPAAAELLEQDGWHAPASDTFPTGQELLQKYVTPLAAHPDINPHVHLNAQVRQVSRLHHDVLRTEGRNTAPFVLRVSTPEGERDVLTQAVIDASGTYQTPNWLGAHGIPALGESAAADAIAYGVPNILGSRRNHYANKSVLVIGGGHSAFNALQDLVLLADQSPDTRILWGLRGASAPNVVRSPENDELKERRQLEVRIQELLEQGRIEVFTNVEVDAILQEDDKLVVQTSSIQLPPVDRIIAATGFRPDLSLLAELRTAIDPATQSPTRLAPLIDPNMHSCGSVPEHGAAELSHPEPGLFILGIKSYGRAPTFLLRTGYKQVLSAVAALGCTDIPETVQPCPAATCQG
ncbi:FAD-dependent oxidoreductase [Marinobacter sp. 2_MG-2023]|uniref:FAD-dependent oxidoreductase n=1 Tax=Marinobacter sp. 2_MG-2023 TaxID=3062679 RepID=UPI0026E3238D|nr:FAD-dependent oxidoreductase [Marinobacter sp. 2_MG-2023]MDO6440536.1 FAD-dependent oxidoreductase [Marinobacter sp. 2_MG-2023]